MPFLRRQLEIIKPEVVVALGSTAADALLGDIVKNKKMHEIVGAFFENVDHALPEKIAVHYHPQYLGYRSYDVGLERDYIDFFKRINDGEI
jgi:uracil-DNA glycosylase family 4